MIMQIIGYMGLCLGYLVAAGMFLRIVKFKKTGDEKYKNWFYPWGRTKPNNGKHCK